MSRKNQKYSAEFKLSVILDMRNNHLGYRETARKYWPETSQENSKHEMIKKWERIYLEEGEIGLSIDLRGRGNKMEISNKGRPRKKPLSPCAEDDLITENQKLREENEYLRMENDYLKKLDALVQERMQREGKKSK